MSQIRDLGIVSIGLVCGARHYMLLLFEVEAHLLAIGNRGALLSAVRVITLVLFAQVIVQLGQLFLLMVRLSHLVLNLDLVFVFGSTFQS